MSHSDEDLGVIVKSKNNFFIFKRRRIKGGQKRYMILRCSNGEAVQCHEATNLRKSEKYLESLIGQSGCGMCDFFVAFFLVMVLSVFIWLFYPIKIASANPITVLLCEAVGEDKRGMQAVGEVYRMRLDEGLPVDARGFSCLARKDLYSFLGKIKSRQKLLARTAWQASQTSDITSGADHYLTRDAYYDALVSGHPKWVKKMKYVTTIGNHVFLKEKK